MKKLLTVLLKIFSTPCIIFQSTISQTNVISRQLNSGEIESINDKNELYWCGKELQYFLYKLTDLNSLSWMTSILKNKNLSDEDIQFFLMNYISNNLVWSENSLSSYQNFFSEAFTYWSENNEKIHNQLWDILNDWFTNIYPISLNRYWFNSINYSKEYYSYIDSYLLDQKKIQFGNSSRGDLSLEDNGYNDLDSQSIEEYSTKVIDSSIDMISSNNNDKNLVDIKSLILSDSNFRLITNATNLWSLKSLNNNSKMVIGNKYRTFNDLDNKLLKQTLNSKKNTSKDNYDPGSNISFNNSLYSLQKIKNISNKKIDNIKNVILNSYNILDSISKEKQDLYLNFIYMYGIYDCKNYDESDIQSFGVKQIRAEWIQNSSSAPIKNTYCSSQYISFAIPETILTSDFINKSFNKLKTTMNDSEDIFYKTTGYVLDGINGMQKIFLPLEESLFKSFVRNGVMTPKKTFNNLNFYGYDILYRSRDVYSFKSSQYAIIILALTIICGVFICGALLSYSILLNKRIIRKK